MVGHGEVEKTDTEGSKTRHLDVGDFTTASPHGVEPFLLWCSSRACERYFDSVCLNMFGLAQRVHIPSLRTAQHAALAHLAATTPSKLDSREGCLHWWRGLLPENFQTELWFDVQRHAGSDAEGSSAVELCRQLLVLECLCTIHSP